MILTGLEIARMIGQQRITVEPFDPTRLQPNSYDLTLAAGFKCYYLGGALGRMILDPRINNATIDVPIPEYGLVLSPGQVYLGSTVETVGSEEFVPRIDGKSSLGRLGVKIHLTAGFVDLGFLAPLTLEIEVTHPTRLYPGMPIAQVSFSTTQGDRAMQYKGRYQGQEGPTPSRMWKNWKKDPFFIEPLVGEVGEDDD